MIKPLLPISHFHRYRIVCALRYSPSTALVHQTNYQTHTPSVHPTFASPTLFEIKLSCGKLVTTAFQHMETICGARKRFLEFSLSLTILAELIDLQEEIHLGNLANVNVFDRKRVV
jgi:hypothetical protein